MRCLYCGKRLALLKKLTDGDFCSVAHRKKYHSEQEQLVVARLAENEDQISRTAGLAPASRRSKRRDSAKFDRVDGTGFAPYLADQLSGQTMRIAVLSEPQLEPFVCEVSWPALGQVEFEFPSEIPLTESTPIEDVETEPAMALALSWISVVPQDGKNPVRFVDCGFLSSSAPRPLTPPAPQLKIQNEPRVAGLVALLTAPDLLEGEHHPIETGLQPKAPARRVRTPRSPLPPSRWCPPPAEKLVGLPHPDAPGSEPRLQPCGELTAQFAIAKRTERLPLRSAFASLEAANASNVVRLLSISTAVQTVAMKAGSACETADFQPFPRRVSMRRARKASILPVEVPVPGMTLLAGAVARPGAYPIRFNGVTAPFWPALIPALPKSRLTPETNWPENVGAVRTPDARSHVKRSSLAWEPVVHLWRTAPADLKWLALALPIISIFVLQSTRGHQGLANTPPVVNAASNPRPPAPGTLRVSDAVMTSRPPVDLISAATVSVPNTGGGWKAALNTRWEILQRIIERRAAVELSDDFRYGLNSWTGSNNWTKSWGYDNVGSVRTGSLALYEPSLNLVDYRVEFLGAIQKHGISWVFRAKDLNNYYAMKLVITKPGPLPQASLVRFAMIDGRETQHFELPLPLNIRNDMLFRIRTEVDGSDFTTSVQGLVVDHFIDERLKTGGVGFFSARGDQACLRCVEVSHQYDTLGRVFSYIAPYNLQAKPDLGEK